MDDGNHINWHAAFREALKAELIDYQDILEYQEEIPLTTEPLRVDLVVIKKKRDIIIKKNIAEIFRGHNLIEYKSPNDNLSINDYHKVCSYLYLYISLHNINITDVTLTVLENRHPRGLLKYFKQLGILVEEKTPGVYVTRDYAFPVQIIESKKLPEDENIWLRNLKRGVSAVNMQRLLKLQGKDYLNISLKAYLYALLLANPESIKEMEADNMGGATLAQVLEEMGWTEKWEARGVAIGEARGEARGMLRGINGTLHVIKGLKNNVPLEKLAEESNMPIEEIEKVKQEVM